VSKIVKDLYNKKGMNVPFILMEPGRTIVGPAGITLYTVGAVKEIKDIRKYVSIDGGMADNPRYALYQATYEAALANKMNEERTDIVTIAGKCCESSDLIGKDMKLQNAVPGDIVAIFSTGAYNYSMSSNYNRLPKPPIVLVKDGNSRLILKRETYSDIVRNDILPEDL
jgi:diaminopimelate decarboxylase